MAKGKASAHVTELRETIKEVVGEERYSRMLIFCDRRAHDYRFKICGNKLTDDEITDIITGMKQKKVTVTSKRGTANSFRGSFPTIIFYVPIA